MAEDTSNSTPLPVPDWFWAILDSARPDLQRLVEWLEAATREQMVEFQRTYEMAAQEVCDYWSGPTVDGIDFSEDDTEDFCRWIVSQGRVLWKQSVETSDLESFVRLYWASRSKSDTKWPKWNTSVINPLYRGYQAPGSVAYAVFEVRFTESLDEYLA